MVTRKQLEALKKGREALRKKREEMIKKKKYRKPIGNTIVFPIKSKKKKVLKGRKSFWDTW